MKCKLPQSDDYHGAKYKAVYKTVNTKPQEVRIRIAGEQRPGNWEEPR